MPKRFREALGTVHLPRNHRAQLLPRPRPLDPGGAHLGRGDGRGSRRATFREGLHDVVQERLELVREIDVVNDHVVVAGLLDGAVEVWLPQAKPIAKRPLKLVIADHVAGRWNAGGGVRREADLVCPGFRLSLLAEPKNAQRAFDVVHHGTVPLCLPFPTIAEGCQVMMLRLAEGLGLPPFGPDNFPDYVQAMETARIGGDPA